MKKRVLSLLLCALMVVQFLPIGLLSTNAAPTTMYSLESDNEVQGAASLVSTTPGGATFYTATANGVANLTSTTSVALVFETPVPGLTATDITIMDGTASVTKGALTVVDGSNTKYNLAISAVSIEGNINLKITKDGVDNSLKVVDVHRIPITFTVANVGGTAFVRDSTSIRLTFNAAISNLSADDIILSPGTPAAISNYATSTAQKGSLTKVSDTVYELALTGITKTGTLGVKVNKVGIETNQKNVIVNAKVDKTALQPTPPRSYFPQNITNLPKTAGLPDLFQFLDSAAGTNGRVATSADWQNRRGELKDLIQYYYYGRKYPTPKSAVTVNAQTNQVNVTINDNGRTVTASLGTVTVPTGTAPEGGWPVIIAFGFGQTAMATQNGYAVISVSNWGGSRTGNYYNLYPFNPYEYDFNTGSIMTAAWSVSRIIDAMEISAAANGGMNQWKINPSKSITTGVSINGKYALMAAAMDDRVGGAAPVDCGQSGASSFRYINEGRLFYYNGPVDKIYRRNQKGLNSIQYSGESFWMGLGTAAGFHQQTDMDYLPFDAHAVEALMAPRPLIAFTSDNNFDWTTPPSSVADMFAAKEVYEFLGKGGNIAVRVRDGAHAIQDRDVPFMIAIMDKEFSGKPLEVRNLYPNSNPPSYGIGTYAKISDMTIYPYDIDSSYIRWARPGKYTLWSENEIVTEGMPETIKIHSDAPIVKLTILDADNKPTSATWMANVKNGTAVFNLSAQQVKVGRYEVTTVGSDKDSKTVYFQGVDVATALRHGTARNDNGAAVMYGFTSKIDKNLVEVYADGSKLTQSLQEDTEQAWILNYGVTTNPNENNRILNNAFNVITLKKLQMEAMPGYTFEISIDKSKLANNQETVSWNASAAVQKIGPQPNWPPYPNNLTEAGTTDAGIRLLKPATTTSFSAVTTFSLNDAVDLAVGSKLRIAFSEPMYKGDFGVGFDFSDNFTLAWAEDNKSVEVTFNNITNVKGAVCSMYIMRLSDAAGNMIAAPIYHSFTLKSAPSQPVQTPSSTGSQPSPVVSSTPSEDVSPANIASKPIKGVAIGTSKEILDNAEKAFKQNPGVVQSSQPITMAAPPATNSGLTPVSVPIPAGTKFTALVSPNADGSFTPVPTYTDKNGTVYALVNEAKTLIPVTINTSFSDVSAGNWFAESAKIASELGIILGNGDSTFKPDVTVTNQQTVTMLMRTVGFNANYDNVLKTAGEKGIKSASGLNNSGFTSRTTTAVLIKDILASLNINVSLTKDEKASLLAPFNDLKGLTDEETLAIAVAVKYGILGGTYKGKDYSTMSPDMLLTRAQMATISTRLLKFLIK